MTICDELNTLRTEGASILQVRYNLRFLSGSHILWVIYVMNKEQASRWTLQLLCCVKQSGKSIILKNKQAKL